MSTRRRDIRARGFSLIEILIGLSLISILAGVVGTSTLEERKVQKQALMMSLKAEIAEDLRNDLSLYTHCGALIVPALGYSANTPVASTLTAPLAVAQFNLLFDHPAVSITTVTLNYTQDKTPDLQKGSSYTSYQGDLVITVTPKGNTDNIYAGLGAISLPISLYDQTGSGQWGNISCATQHSTVSSSFGETCALYGGTLTDGTHCDFNRVLRGNAANTAPSPTIAIADTSAPEVSHHNLSDVLCYIDTLITMIPDENTAVSPRNYNLDSYKRDYYTRFCKRPGHVAKAANVNMLGQMKTASGDVGGDIMSLAGVCNFVYTDPKTKEVECLSSCTKPGLGKTQGSTTCLSP